MSEIRYDELHDDYVLIAPERLHRPDCARVPGHSELPARKCPFCEGNEAMTPPEIFALRKKGGANRPGWKSRVVPNLYKAVRIEAPWQNHEKGPYRYWEGFGAHEVIIDTPRHLLRMDDWTPEEYFNWLFTLRSRLGDLRNDLRLVYFSLFKNHGHYAGATQSHPHSQLIALPAVPGTVLERMRRAREYRRNRGHSLFRGVLEYEEEQRERIVAENGSFVSFCPYASAFAFEVTVLARGNAVSSLIDLDDKGLRDLGEILKLSIDALYRELGDLDFNITFNTPPLQKNSATEDFFDETSEIWSLQVRIIPRLYGWGGFEIESGLRINPVPPEEAALLLRGQESRSD